VETINPPLQLVNPLAAVFDALALSLKLTFGALSPNRLAFKLPCEGGYVSPHDLPHDLPDEGD
jgi:hypothetical protein